MTIKFSSTALILASGLIASAPSFAGLTTEQVRAELVQAIRTGDITYGGEIAAKCNGLHPSMHTVI